MTANSVRRHRAASDPVRPRSTAFPAQPSVDDRMLDLAYRVADQLGFSSRATERLCRRMFRDAPSWLQRPPPIDPATTGRADPSVARRTRTRYLLALRAAIGARIDRRRVDEALRCAVFADEVSLLPPRQRLALSLAVQRHYSVRQIIDHTGWSSNQVTRILRAAMVTVTSYGIPS